MEQLNIKTIVGDLIKKSELTHGEIAKMSGLTPNRVNDLSSGRVKNINIEDIEGLSVALKTNIFNYLCSHEDKLVKEPSVSYGNTIFVNKLQYDNDFLQSTVKDLIEIIKSKSNEKNVHGSGSTGEPNGNGAKSGG